jgi:hypothetical protein
MFDRSRGIPIWLWGAIFAVLLIALSTRGRFDPTNEALRQVFAAQPPPAGGLPTLDLPALNLTSLPAELQQSARDLLATLGAGGAGRPVEPRAETARLRVEVRELRPIEGGLQVLGTVTNQSPGDLLVPISAFELRDSTGVSYIAGGGASATLAPGASTPLDLTVPLPAERGLLLITNLPPDPPVEQILIATATSSA